MPLPSSERPALAVPDHAHVLTQDPRWYGYRCAVSGCDHFKPVAEFDGIATPAHQTVGGA